MTDVKKFTKDKEVTVPGQADTRDALQGQKPQEDMKRTVKKVSGSKSNMPHTCLIPRLVAPGNFRDGANLEDNATMH